jgi:hypothetical protein
MVNGKNCYCKLVVFQHWNMYGYEIQSILNGFLSVMESFPTVLFLHYKNAGIIYCSWISYSFPLNVNHSISFRTIASFIALALNATQWIHSCTVTIFNTIAKYRSRLINIISVSEWEDQAGRKCCIALGLQQKHGARERDNKNECSQRERSLSPTILWHGAIDIKVHVSDATMCIMQRRVCAQRHFCSSRLPLTLVSSACSSLLKNDAFWHTQARLSAAAIMHPRRVFAPSRLLLAHNSLQIFIVRRPSAFLDCRRAKKTPLLLAQGETIRERDETRTPLQVMAARQCVFGNKRGVMRW